MSSRLAVGRVGLLLFALALVPRVLFWWEWNRAGLLNLPVVDALTFHLEARGLLDGTWPGNEPFWQAPLYSFFLGAVYAAFGDDGATVRLVHALLGALTAVLTWILARRWLPPAWALGAFAVVGLHGPLLYFEGQLLRETLANVLLVAWATLLLGILHSPRVWMWGSCGWVLGLTALCRENALVLLPLLVWGAMAAGGGSTDRRRGGRWLPLAAALGGLALAIGPVTVHNWRQEPDLVPISSSGGINFFLGNNAESSETLAIRPGSRWQALLDEPRRAGAETAADRSRYFYGKALRWIASDPPGFVANTLRKAAVLLSAHEQGRNQDIYPSRSGSWVLRVTMWKAGPIGFPFGLLLPFAALGACALLRGGPLRSAVSAPEGRASKGEGSTLLLLVGLYVLGVLLYLPAARYRIPLVPFLAVLAMIGARAWLGACWPRPRARLRGRDRSCLAAVGVFLSAALAANGGWIETREDPADQAFLQGSALAEFGQVEDALVELDRAVRLEPGHADAWTALAALKGRTGRGEESVRAALTAITIDSTLVMPWVNLGTTLLAAGDFRSAEPSLRRALALDPDMPEARLSLAELLVRTERREEARAILAEGAERRGDSGPLWLALGDLDARAGRWVEAAAALSRAVERMPRNADAWNNLGLVLVQLGRHDEATRAFDRAMELDPGHVRARENRTRLGGTEP